MQKLLKLHMNSLYGENVCSDITEKKNVNQNIG